MPAQDAKTKNSPTVGAIFRCLYESAEPLTKQEVADRCGISLPTVYQGFSALEEQGLLEAGADRGSTGGRRAQTFTATHSGVATIGVSLTGHSARCVACNLYGERLEDLYLKQPLPKERTVGALREAIGQMTTRMAEELAARGSQVAGVGIAVPSAIDPETGRLLNTSVLRVEKGGLLASELAAGLEYPADVFNDANCGGFSQCFPAPDGCDLAYLSLERGVGGAVIIGGRPFEGPRGTSGEFGHICLEPGGKACACGRAGCLEAYCSSNVLSEERGRTLDEFFSQVETGDTGAVAALDEYVGHLARGIQTIHTMLGVDVALGGEMASYLEPHFDKICEAVAAIDPFPTGEPCVMRAKHPHHGVPIGAAQLMAQRFIESV
jgi:predicted NBD/HSP70 family sugar kinase